MYKKILVPIDGSDSSIMALKHAAKLAEIVGAEITLFHVMNIPTQVHTYSGKLRKAHYLIREKFEEYAQEVSQEIFEKAREDLSAWKVTFTEKTAWGEPANEIILEGQQGGYDIIVIGSRGLSEVKGWLLGSVSQRVVQHSKCPVLIIK